MPGVDRIHFVIPNIAVAAAPVFTKAQVSVLFALKLRQISGSVCSKWSTSCLKLG